MAPLAVDPEALSAAGNAVVAAGDGVAAALAVLTAGFGANTGLDAAGAVFGLAYQDAAESLMKAAAAAINACRFNGAKIQLCASNYSVAEAASMLGGGTGVLRPPVSRCGSLLLVRRGRWVLGSHRLCCGLWCSRSSVMCGRTGTWRGCTRRRRRGVALRVRSVGRGLGERVDVISGCAADCRR
ncbi:hypothetical protein [Mycobacterium riyadhense]|uniref:hypothetical protein n=1 Tax=Mycobacterium riyadhense TaxID=486698 RepID=UPI001EF9DF10|nr:hypothetical protein [Mycobacterium riyadhense]